MVVAGIKEQDLIAAVSIYLSYLGFSNIKIHEQNNQQNANKDGTKTDRKQAKYIPTQTNESNEN